jgi:hypothetical protein
VNETGDQSEDPSSTEQASTELHGRRPGDRRVRVKRPYAEFFRYAGPGMLVARPAASRPRTASDRLLTRLRGLLIGRPLSIHEEITERLSKKKALAIFSSDPISSSAYASEEMLRVLALAGAGALLTQPARWPQASPSHCCCSSSRSATGRSWAPIRQGGGDYAVARRNLPAMASLDRRRSAAARLRHDRCGVDSVGSRPARCPPFPSPCTTCKIWSWASSLDRADHAGQPARHPRVGQHLRPPDLPLRRLGAADDRHGPVPGAGQRRGRVCHPNRCPARAASTRGRWAFLLILRAFASGSVALTGTEAIANGVPAFKPPESRNAAATLDRRLPVMLAVLFIGITFVAVRIRHRRPIDRARPASTVISQVAAVVFGDELRLPSTLFQTVHRADPVPRRQHQLQRLPAAGRHPRSRRLHAAPVQLPRRPAGIHLGHRRAERGRRRLYLVAFGGDTHALIPLYSVGVFLAFTIGQAGMIVHWRREKSSRLATAPASR